jgi:hypothetical protein
MPRRSQQPKRQSIKLDGYHVYVSTNNFDKCILTQDGANYDDLLQQLKPNAPNQDFTESDIIFKKACKDPEWRQSMVEEVKSHHKNNTYTIEELPLKKKALNCRWVFKLKSLKFVNFIHFNQ